MEADQLLGSSKAMKTNVSQPAPGTPVRGSRSSTAHEVTKETRLKIKLTKTDSLHFTKPYLGSNSLMSREKNPENFM